VHCVKVYWEVIHLVIKEGSVLLMHGVTMKFTEKSIAAFPLQIWLGEHTTHLRNPFNARLVSPFFYLPSFVLMPSPRSLLCTTSALPLELKFAVFYDMHCQSPSHYEAHNLLQ